MNDRDAGAYDELTARAARQVGRVLRQKWTLDALLGVGGMAAVYSATHRNGSSGAVKLLHPELSVDPDIRGRFLREGYVANQVAHPGTVKVLDDDEDEGSVFLVMELLEGETLEARWERKGRRIAVDEVLSIAEQVLDVLAVAHDAGIIHRDVKPENLFLTVDGRVKVLDFGIARVRAASTRARTRSGSTLGTPAFMAPEHARGRWDEVDARSDVWAVGATLFTLITGRLVHGVASTVNEQLLAAMTQAAPSLLDVLPSAGSEVARVVDRALAFDKTARWPDARAMQLAVREAYAALEGRSITTAPVLEVPAGALQTPSLAQAPTANPVTRSAAALVSAFVSGYGVRSFIALGVASFVSVAIGIALVHAIRASTSAPAPSAVAGVTSSDGPSHAETRPTPALVSSKGPPDIQAVPVADLPRAPDDSTTPERELPARATPARATASSSPSAVRTDKAPAPASGVGAVERSPKARDLESQRKAGQPTQNGAPKLDPLNSQW